MTGQDQTAASFGYQWTRTEAYNSPGMRAHAIEWLLERYGFDSTEAMQRHFERGRMLDVGSGGGFTTSLWMDETWAGAYTGVEISEAVEVARERLSYPGVRFVQADLMAMPLEPANFDTVFSEGALHHTPSTRDALAAAARMLRPGGEILFYVYRTKGPIREFTDDYIRERVSGLPLDDAWAEMRSLTALGQALAAPHAEIDVPAVPLLGIEAGRQDVQRLVYWSFAKLFWNDAYTFEENVHINFDWYRPVFSHRQTEAEVRAWCDELGLSIDRCYVDDAGITVRARRDSPRSQT